MVSLISSYNRLTANLTTSLKRISEQPVIKREAEYYKANISSIKSVEDFMGNTRIYNFALKAFGLEDMQYAKAFVRKVLVEGIDDPKSFSLQLADQRFREFATVFNFKRYQSATTSFERAQSGTVDMFLRNSLEAQSGQTSEALRLSLYFERKAATITSAYGILADKALYQVARTAFNLPEALSSADIDKQAAILNEKIDVGKLDDPTYRKTFIRRFLAQFEAAQSGVQSNPAATILSGSNSGVDMGLIMSLQSLKRFGS
jgi:Protein of unknown function (DUF1217)